MEVDSTRRFVSESKKRLNSCSWFIKSWHWAYQPNDPFNYLGNIQRWYLMTWEWASTMSYHPHYTLKEQHILYHQYLISALLFTVPFRHRSPASGSTWVWPCPWLATLSGAWCCDVTILQWLLPSTAEWRWHKGHPVSVRPPFACSSKNDRDQWDRHWNGETITLGSEPRSCTYSVSEFQQALHGSYQTKSPCSVCRCVPAGCLQNKFWRRVHDQGGAFLL